MGVEWNLYLILFKSLHLFFIYFRKKYELELRPQGVSKTLQCP